MLTSPIKEEIEKIPPKPIVPIFNLTNDLREKECEIFKGVVLRPSHNSRGSGTLGTGVVIGGRRTSLGPLASPSIGNQFTKGSESISDFDDVKSK